MFPSLANFRTQERSRRPDDDAGAAARRARRARWHRDVVLLAGIGGSSVVIAAAVIGWPTDARSPAALSAAAVSVQRAPSAPGAVFAPADRLALRTQLLGDAGGYIAAAAPPTMTMHPVPAPPAHPVTPPPAALPPSLPPPAPAPSRPQAAAPVDSSAAPPLRPAPQASSAAAVAAQPSPQVAEAQRLLARLGYSIGTADGITGQRTRAALLLYQQKRRLVADGTVSPRLVQLLREDLRRQTRPPARVSSATTTNEAPHPPAQSGWIGTIAGGFQRLIGKQINSVTRPAELRAYCRENPDTWIFDEGRDSFIWCGNFTAAGRG